MITRTVHRCEDSGTLRVAQASIWIASFSSPVRYQNYFHLPGIKLISTARYQTYFRLAGIKSKFFKMQICLHVHPPQLGVCSQAGLVALASLLSSDDLNKPELQLLQVVDMISITMVRLINIITQLLAALSILVQPLLQTAFLLDASCRTTGTSAQARAKPGRQAVTFLLVTVIVILLNTIISHNQRCSITIVTIKITGRQADTFLGGVGDHQVEHHHHHHHHHDFEEDTTRFATWQCGLPACLRRRGMMRAQYRSL